MESYFSGVLIWSLGVVLGACGMYVYMTRGRRPARSSRIWEEAPTREIRRKDLPPPPSAQGAQMDRVKIGTVSPGRHRPVRGKRPRKLED